MFLCFQGKEMLKILVNSKNLEFPQTALKR